MKNLKQGENIALAQAGITGNTIFSGISWNIKSNQQVDIDVSAFLLNSQGKVSDDTDFIFYNQKEDAAKSILLNTEPSNGQDIQLFSIKINKLPAHIHKIIFVAIIDKAIERSQNFSLIDDICIRIFEPDGFNEKTIIFKLTQAEKETAVVLGELYLHQLNWKFKGLGQGFESGLDAIAQLYGVDLACDDLDLNEKKENIDLNSNDHFIDQKLIETEIHINKSFKKLLPKIKRAVEQNLNESNTRMILDRIFVDIFGYNIDEVKAEVKIQGRRADYVLAVDDKDVIVVEAKKAGIPLKEEHIFQASSYGAYSGIKFVLLTNLSEWLLFKIKTEDIVENDVIIGIDFLNDYDVKDIKNLALISRYGMTKGELLENLCDQVIASSPSNISRLLLTSEILDALKFIIKREQKCDVSQEQIQESIELLLGIY